MFKSRLFTARLWQAKMWGRSGAIQSLAKIFMSPMRGLWGPL
jgi:exopolyphosphatase/pppGpp-phosphohydrolase